MKQKKKDTTNTYMYYNCTKLTNCEEKLESKGSFAKISIMKGNLVLSTELITWTDYREEFQRLRFDC